MSNRLTRKDILVALLYGAVSFVGALVIINIRRRIDNRQEVKMLGKS